MALSHGPFVPSLDDFPWFSWPVDGPRRVLMKQEEGHTRYHPKKGESVSASSFHKTDGNRVQAVRQQTCLDLPFENEN